MAEARNIQISNLPDIDEIDKAKVNSSLVGCYDKLARVLNNKLLLRAHFKQQHVGGARKEHSVRLHLSAPGIEVVASEKDWNLLTALQKAVSVLERETIKKVKG